VDCDANPIVFQNTAGNNSDSYVGEMEQDEAEAIEQDEAVAEGRFPTIPSSDNILHTTTDSQVDENCILHTQSLNSNNQQQNPNSYDWNFPDHLLLTPYQPSRNNSLNSFVGVPLDAADGIFLAPRRQRRRRDQQQQHDEETDEFSTSFDDEISFPSIRLARHITGSTTTLDDDTTLGEGSVSFEDTVVGDKVYVTRLPREVDYSQQQHVVDNNGDDGGCLVVLDPQEEEVPGSEWIRTIEVGVENQFVAEAASSKFLTGKRVRTLCASGSGGSAAVNGYNSNMARTNNRTVMGRNISTFQGPRSRWVAGGGTAAGPQGTSNRRMASSRSGTSRRKMTCSSFVK